MEQNKLWFELKATSPYATWQNQITLVVAMFDYDGAMISYLTTDDISPSYDASDSKKCHPRLKMVSRDDPGNNLRVRSIEFDLIATTFHTYPEVASIILGIWLPICSSLSEFGRVGGEVRLIIGQKTSETTPVSTHDFPLKWLGNKNACVVGCLIKTTNSTDLRIDQRGGGGVGGSSHGGGVGGGSGGGGGGCDVLPDDLMWGTTAAAMSSADRRRHPANVCDHWFFRYSTAVAVSNSSPDLLAIFKEETKQNRVLMLHQAYSGCIPLTQFLNAGRNVVIQDGSAKPADPWLGAQAGGMAAKSVPQNESWLLESDKRKFDANAKIDAMDNPSSRVSKILKTQTHLDNLDRWEVASLPFDKISFMLNYLNQRMDLQDQNLADFWKMVNFVKLEADFNDDQLAIVGALAERLEDYEHLLLQMYNSTAQKSLEIKEMLSYYDHITPADRDVNKASTNAPSPLEGASPMLHKLTAAALTEVQTRAEADASLFEYERLVRSRQRDSSELAAATTRLIGDLCADVPHRRRLTAKAQDLLDDKPVEFKEEAVLKKYFI